MPQIEKAKDKGYEILFFKDGVDEFVAKLLGEYEGKKFKSVSDLDFTLDTEEEKKELDKKSEELKDLLLEIKANLGDKVKEVKLTSKLVSYPVCLTAGGDISSKWKRPLQAYQTTGKRLRLKRFWKLAQNIKF